MTVHMIRPRDLEWSFGDRVRKVRREAGLTQRQIATELGVTAASVDAWESERNKPRDLQGMATRIEQAFGLPRGWMLGYADGPHVGGHQVNVAGAGFEPATSGLRASQHGLARIIPFPRSVANLALIA